MRVEAALAPVNRADNGATTLHLSDAGGLRQFGCYLEELPPGAQSSERHWHSAEDEALFLLSGRAVVVDDDGDHDLAPGDAAVWRRGQPNAHHLQNRSDAPCRYIIVGSRVAGDICHYPDSGRRLINRATTWEVVGADNQRLRGGDLPDALMGLTADWGAPRDEGIAPRRIQRAEGRDWAREDAPLHPVLGGLDPYQHCILGDTGGLTQFGLHLEALPPGGASSFRHWHEGEDEMIHLLSGQLILIEDAETALAPGDSACWAAGVPVGHCLVNRGTDPAIYLTIGTRLRRDVIHYPDHDLITHKDGPARRYTHADGRPRFQGGKQ